MKLIALLSWYDESPAVLSQLVSSLAAAGIDELVAVDGAYALFPDGRACSPPDQATAIRAAAWPGRLGITIRQPRMVWAGNETEKRTAMFALGHGIAEPGDWLWIADADELVLEACGVRKALEQTDRQVASVTLEHICSYSGRRGAFMIRKLFKVQPNGIHVEGNHYTYRTGDGRPLWLGQDETSPGLLEAEYLPFVRIAHREGVRSDDRLRRREMYYRARDEQLVEVAG